jgi:cytochrome c oxidase cbb3-type subunit 3
VRILNPQLLEHASPGFLRSVIRKGRPPTAMPAFEGKLPEESIDAAVAYLAMLPKMPLLQKAGIMPLPPPIPAGAVPLHPSGPAPIGFTPHPGFTKVEVVARELVRKARMTIVDARTPADYAQEHIAGAVNVPYYDSAPYFASLPKQGWIVCYCGCPHAESGALAQQLTAAGFRDVTVLDEGLNEWKAKGHPMRRGQKP